MPNCDLPMASTAHELATLALANEEIESIGRSIRAMGIDRIASK